MATGHHRERGRIAASDFNACGQQGLHGFCAGAHGHHRAARLFKHGLAACDHGSHGLLNGEHARMARGRVFANAVADHGVWL